MIYFIVFCIGFACGIVLIVLSSLIYSMPRENLKEKCIYKYGANSIQGKTNRTILRGYLQSELNKKLSTQKE